VKEARAVADGLASFYEAFNSGDAQTFAAAIADVESVSVIGTAPGEGHDDREDWIRTYADQIAEAGMTLRGKEPRGWAEGSVGFARDEPSFVLADGGELETRLTAVLREDGGRWQVVHLHFSVGVPD